MTPVKSRLGKDLGRRILVAFEGETEENYIFALRKAWGFQKEQVEIVDADGSDPLSLVKAVIGVRDVYVKDGAYCEADGDTSWACFDIDEHLESDPRRFNKAIALADSEGVNLGASSPSFELWVAQHFAPITASMNCNEAVRAVRKSVKDYAKNYPRDRFIEMVFPSLQQALANARSLEKRNRSHPYNRIRFNNPSTAFHRLVEEIRLLKK